MNTLRQSPPPPVEMLTGRQTLWYLLPFFTTMVFPMLGKVPGNFFYLLLLGLLLLILWVLVNGFFYGFPALVGDFQPAAEYPGYAGWARPDGCIWISAQSWDQDERA